MSISAPIEFKAISKAEFEEIDAVVMQSAYEAQNHYGRLCDEKVYETDIAHSLKQKGLKDLRTQVPISVSFRSFHKTYYLDLVVNGMVYELKATSSLSAVHEAQVLNYTALLDINRIKLLNFGSDQVQGKLLCTPFSQLDRFALSFHTNRFRSITSDCKSFFETVQTMFRELGGFLSSSIYNEAIVENYGGEQVCNQRLPVFRNGIEMGTQSMQVFHHKCGFLITSLPPKDINSYEKHLYSLTRTLNILGFQWINFHQSHVSFITIS